MQIKINFGLRLIYRVYLESDIITLLAITIDTFILLLYVYETNITMSSNYNKLKLNY